MEKFKVTLGSETKSYNVREIRTLIERTEIEQAKRKERLDSKQKMAAYAKDKGISTSEMQKLTRENYSNNQKYLKTLKFVSSTDQFKKAEAASKAKSKSLFSKAKDLSPRGGGAMTDLSQRTGATAKGTLFKKKLN
jgi:replication initiation and membrane attachment protein DnaB